jgi:hypothetical protein
MPDSFLLHQLVGDAQLVIAPQSDELRAHDILDQKVSITHHGP